VKRLIIGCLICLIAMVIPPLVMVFLFSHSLPVSRGLLPGKMELKLETNSNYVLWNDYVCDYDGKLYNLTKDLPSDWRFQLIAPDGDKLDIQIPVKKINNAGKQISSRKEAEFKSAWNGAYVLIVTGSGEKRPFSVRPNIQAAVKRIFLPTFIGSLVVGLVGFVCVMWGGYDLIMTSSRQRKEKSA